jgi:integrase
MTTAPQFTPQFTPQRARPRRQYAVNPITRDVLDEVIAVCDRATPTGARDALLLGIGWELALRLGQLAALTVEDVERDRLPARPSDTVMGLYRAWMDMRAAVGIPATGPLFLRIFSGHISPAKGLSGDQVNRGVIQARIHEARIPDAKRYSADSLYLGGRFPDGYPDAP